MANAYSLSKFKLTRKGRKLQTADDLKTLLALPKDIPERTWAEILQKEEVDLLVFEIREEMLEAALAICYKKYMENQSFIFTVHCAAKAWLKLINWYFYRHDPGEDPSANPPCYIPKRRESWIPDDMPEPSPKDTWGRHDLVVLEETREQYPQKEESATILEYSHVDEIPPEFWFPGKVKLPDELNMPATQNSDYESSDVTQTTDLQPEENFSNGSEVLQKVTEYSGEEIVKVSETVSVISALKTTTPVNGSLHGAGDSKLRVTRQKPRRAADKTSLIKSGTVRSNKMLPPLDLGDSRSYISRISDCRLRNLRLETQYEISSEKMNTPPGENKSNKGKPK